MNDLNALKAILAVPKDIVITSHRNPDGDAIGSSLALYHFLKKNGHTVHVIFPSEYPEFLSWMEAANDILIYDIETEEPNRIMEKADLIYSLDYNSLDRIDKLGQFIAETKAQKVMIDHHLYPENFADFMFSDSTASSTCEMIFEFICDLGAKKQIDLTIGECIMTGILTDTGSFKYATSAKLFNIVSELLEIGVDDYRLQDLIFNSQVEKNLRLLGHCLTNRMEIIPEYQTGIITLNRKDYEEFDIQRGDTEGIVNFLLKMKKIKVAIFITEQPTIVKLSFRSKGDYDVQEIAHKHFKGGGHKNAAGGASFRSLKATVYQIKELLPLYKEKLYVGKD